MATCPPLKSLQSPKPYHKKPLKSTKSMKLNKLNSLTSG